MTWISVNDRLPPESDDGESEPVLVWPRSEAGCVYQRLAVYSFRRERWEQDSTYFGGLDLPVTHWMKLPDGPPEDDQ